MIRIDFSIDQSRTATGLCLWVEGKPKELATARPGKGITGFEKSEDVTDKVTEILDRWRWEWWPEDSQSPPDTIVLEAFEKHYPKAKIGKLMILAEFTGFLHGTLKIFFPEATIVHVSKGKAPKSQAALLAAKFGLKGSKDAMDALHIGFCAGLYKE